MAQASGLTVRQHERRSIERDVEVGICDEHQQQVRFSPASSAKGQTVVRGKVTDISPGGMGMTFSQFVPKMCEGQVRVFSPTPVGRGADDMPVYDTIFEHEVKIRRVYMISHEPTYAAGASFVDPEPDLSARVEEVLLAAGRQGADSGTTDA
ncbi:MAG: hypothetical protein ACYTGC_10970 [Planctomycetota bacterium]|jgi:c-di-GMP-binding flagellar brake protein YcgR